MKLQKEIHGSLHSSERISAHAGTKGQRRMIVSRTSLTVFRGAIAAIMLTGPAPGADGRLASVKNIYLDRAANPTANGMRFEIELERPDGTRLEVPVNYDFRSGDRIRLRMDVRNSVYVYVLNRTLTGEDKGIEIVREQDAQRRPTVAEAPRLVFGPEKLSRGSARVAPKRDVMRFDANPGIEKLYVILAPKPLKLESAFDREGRFIFDDPKSPITDLDRRLYEWSNNADVAMPDKDGAKGGSADNYGYCVERRPSQAMMFEITLRHSS